jgi:hypothetical protein
MQRKQPRARLLIARCLATGRPGSTSRLCLYEGAKRRSSARAEDSALIAAPCQDFVALQLPLSTGLFQVPDIDLPLLETVPV